MRGPLLSGPLGSSATLERLCVLLRRQPPSVVLSSLWLGFALAEEISVAVAVEPEARAAARRALKRAAATDRGALVVIAGEDLPLAPAAAGSLVVEGLHEIEGPDAAAFFGGLPRYVRPGGFLISLDDTKDPAVEARVAGLFMAAALLDIVQERPKEGALITAGTVPARAVWAAAVGMGGETNGSG